MLRVILHVTSLATVLSCSPAATGTATQEGSTALDVAHCFLEAGRQSVGLTPLDPGSDQKEVRVWLLEGGGVPHYLLRVVKEGGRLIGEAIELFPSYSTSDSLEDDTRNTGESAAWCGVLGTKIGYRARPLRGLGVDWERIFKDASEIARYEVTPASASTTHDEPVIIVESLDTVRYRTSTLLEPRSDRSEEDRLAAQLRTRILESLSAQ